MASPKETDERNSTPGAVPSPEPAEFNSVFERLETLVKSQFAETTPVENPLAELGAQNVSVAVMDAGKVTANILGAPKVKVGNHSTASLNNETIFQACSISKSITSLAVIKLCQEGKLKLDSPISDFLSQDQLRWVSTPMTFELASGITLRQLLSHTSGLSTNGFAGYGEYPIPTVQDILTGSTPANNQPIRPFLLPGQKFSYSGGGYTVIQLILETVFKKSFNQILTETVLQPLSMSHSTFEFLRDDEKNYAPAYVTGKLKASPDHNDLPEFAAAGLWTTPTELLRAIQAIQSSFEPGGFLEPAWAKTMLTEVKEGMALGWMTKKGGTTFHHTGGNEPGYRCIVIGYADLADPSSILGPNPGGQAAMRSSKTPKNTAVCIMTSSALGINVYSKVLQAIPYLKGWPSITASPYVPFFDPAREIDGRAAEWVGAWDSGQWELLGNENGMAIKYGPAVQVKLLPAAIAPHQYAEGPSIDLVLQGLEMMLRLGWKDGSRIIDVWQNGDIITLEP